MFQTCLTCWNHQPMFFQSISKKHLQVLRKEFDSAKWCGPETLPVETTFTFISLLGTQQWIFVDVLFHAKVKASIGQFTLFLLPMFPMFLSKCRQFFFYTNSFRGWCSWLVLVAVTCHTPTWAATKGQLASCCIIGDEKQPSLYRDLQYPKNPNLTLP